MIQIDAIPAFTDNYIWVLHNGHHAVLVDPGDAQPAMAELRQRGLQLQAILITHHHPDHIGGLPTLLEHYAVPVYGPAAEARKIGLISHPLNDGDRVQIKNLNLDLQVLALPGHTLGHIAYYQPDMLLVGDTLFKAGCGRLFEGSPEQMQTSLARLRALPENTAVYCTHEYTLANIAFAQRVEPNNPAIKEAAIAAEKMRAESLPTLPSSIGLERQINPFLRWDEPEVIRCAQRLGAKGDHPSAVFAAIRAWKDRG